MLPTTPSHDLRLVVVATPPGERQNELRPAAPCLQRACWPKLILQACLDICSKGHRALLSMPDITGHARRFWTSTPFPDGLTAASLIMLAEQRPMFSGPPNAFAHLHRVLLLVQCLRQAKSAQSSPRGRLSSWLFAPSACTAVICGTCTARPARGAPGNVQHNMTQGPRQSAQVVGERAQFSIGWQCDVVGAVLETCLQQQRALVARGAH